MNQLVPGFPKKMVGPKLLRLAVFPDERGFFQECYNYKRYRDTGIECPFVQDNLSYSKAGVIRGMHYQSEPGQAKLVSVLKGKIFDAIVDIRPDSPTFGMWEGVILDGAQADQLFIPVGFAHGFCALEDSYVHYKVSSPYNPKTEKGFRYDSVGIKWPDLQPLLSERDLASPTFQEAFL